MLSLPPTLNTSFPESKEKTGRKTSAATAVREGGMEPCRQEGEAIEPRPTPLNGGHRGGVGYHSPGNLPWGVKGSSHILGNPTLGSKAGR